MVGAPGVLGAISACCSMIALGNMDRRTVFLVLTGLLLLTSATSACAPTFGILLVSRILFGMAVGCFWTLATATAARLVGRGDGPRATAIILGGVTLATVLGVPIGTYLAAHVSWRTAFGCMAVASALTLCMQAFLLPRLPPVKAVQFKDLLLVLREEGFAFCLLTAALVLGGHYATYTFITPALQSIFSLDEISVLLCVFGVAGVVSNAIMAAFINRHLRSGTAALIVVLVFSIVVTAIVKSNWIVVFGFVLWGISYGALPLCFSVLIQKTAAGHQEAGSSLFICVIQTAIAIGSSFGGVIVDNFGLVDDFLIGAVGALIGVLFLVSMKSAKIS